MTKPHEHEPDRRESTEGAVRGMVLLLLVILVLIQVFSWNHNHSEISTFGKNLTEIQDWIKENSEEKCILWKTEEITDSVICKGQCYNFSSNDSYPCEHVFSSKDYPQWDLSRHLCYDAIVKKINITTKCLLSNKVFSGTNISTERFFK